MEPTLTSKNLPPSQQPSAGIPAAPTPYEQIVAKPLRAPNFIGLKPKNSSLCGYWGNRAVGEKESGLRYDQLISLGFRPAKPEEVMQANGQPIPPSMSRDGRILYGDLIYLLMPREDYIGSQKWNEQTALARVRKLGQAPVGMEKGQAADGRVPTESAIRNVVQGRAAQAGKVQAYIPKLAETDAKTADNSGGGEFNLAEK